MKIYLKCLLGQFLISSWLINSADAVLAGGRPNAISGGINSFAGVVNPANAVWVEDRVDVGAFLVHQRFSLDNRNNNPRLLPGKTDYTYHVKNLFTADAAINKHIKIQSFDTSFTLAYYTMPGNLKIRTQRAVPGSGTTPILVENNTQVISGIFSLKVNSSHSFGLSLDYFYLSHRRNGYQNSDNPLRSVSPGHVTNKGMDHSQGVGLSLGWRWNITKDLAFGAAFVKKSYVGQFRKYRGYEPHHAKNYIPASLGGGFTYRFTSKIAGRLEVLWTNLGGLPGANNNFLSNGQLNTNKRGSNKSPGPGLQDATFINVGLGYKVNSMLSFGTGLSHRIKLSRPSNILSRTYTLQTIYDAVSFGMNFSYKKFDLFLAISHGFRNRTSGYIPDELGGGKLIAKKHFDALSVALGYRY